MCGDQIVSAPSGRTAGSVRFGREKYSLVFANHEFAWTRLSVLRAIWTTRFQVASGFKAVQIVLVWLADFCISCFGLFTRVASWFELTRPTPAT